jgi:hypothetical protein
MLDSTSMGASEPPLNFLGFVFFIDGAKMLEGGGLSVIREG